jgi:hypothetical protein
MLLLIKGSLETPLEWHGTEIKTPCDLAIGLNMNKSNMKEMKSKNIPSSPELLADKLETIYLELTNG